MTWQDTIAYDQCTHDTITEPLTESRMGPGLTGTYDRELREKMSVRDAPIPPEYMGMEGEYDPLGLAKRVAHELDRRNDLQHIHTLQLAQQGSAIVFFGEIEDRDTLEAIIETASRVDGTRAVDVEDVTIRQTIKQE
jgi:hypothetical protein